MALSLPTEKVRFSLDTFGGNVELADNFDQEQERTGRKVLRPKIFGIKSLNITSRKEGGQKAESFAAFP